MSEYAFETGGVTDIDAAIRHIWKSPPKRLEPDPLDGGKAEPLKWGNARAPGC